MEVVLGFTRKHDLVLPDSRWIWVVREYCSGFLLICGILLLGAFLVWLIGASKTAGVGYDDLYPWKATNCIVHRRQVVKVEKGLYSVTVHWWPNIVSLYPPHPMAITPGLWRSRMVLVASFLIESSVVESRHSDAFWWKLQTRRLFHFVAALQLFEPLDFKPKIPCLYFALISFTLFTKWLYNKIADIGERIDCSDEFYRNVTSSPRIIFLMCCIRVEPATVFSHWSNKKYMSLLPATFLETLIA